MSAWLEVLSTGPQVTLQDSGRPGFLAQGLSRGGAADPLALAEGAALLRQPLGQALEMAGFGGRFSATRDCRIALSGAPMRATLDGTPLRWAASHALPAGAVLEISGATSGLYGYLTLGGGLARGAETPERLGSISAHLAAGIGSVLTPGARLALAPDRLAHISLALEQTPRWTGGTLRVVPSLQTQLYSPAEQRRFEAEAFTRDLRGNRMGLRLVPKGAGFALETGQSILSEVIVPGDIQIPGDGMPYVLLGECQTTGGYPRIGTVIPADLPLVAQAGPGAVLRFRFVDRAAALRAEAQARASIAALPRRVAPLLRDPKDMSDLLSYSLISGVTAGDDLS